VRSFCQAAGAFVSILRSRISMARRASRDRPHTIVVTTPFSPTANAAIVNVRTSSEQSSAAKVGSTVVAAQRSGVRHFIYLSVAQPAPAMKDYVAVRAEGEALLRASGIASTFVRPWYVLGPGHRWPYALLPVYWIWGAFPSQRDTSRRLYPVKLADVVRTIVDAVEHPPDGVRIVEGPEIRLRPDAVRGAGSPARPAAPSAPAHPPA